MIHNALNESFLNTLRSKFPKNSELANKLTDILNIEKEAVYRRLRGEVRFTTNEIAVISQKISISLDNVINLTSARSRPFNLKLTNFIYPQEIDYKMVDEYNLILKEIQGEPNVVFGSASKIIPDGFYLRYKNITNFYMFKWVYQYGNPETVPHFHEVTNTDRMLVKLKESMELYQNLKKAYFILDKWLIRNIVDDIKFFVDIKLIRLEELNLLKNELMEFIDYLEKISITGKNEIGNQIDLYISNLNFETSFSCISSSKYKLSIIRCFTLYDIASLDEMTLIEAQKWLNSLKRSSIFITESGAFYRVQFFDEQRKIIENLSI